MYDPKYYDSKRKDLELKIFRKKDTFIQNVFNLVSDLNADLTEASKELQELEGIKQKGEAELKKDIEKTKK